MGLWNSLRSLGSKIYGGVKSVGSKILGWGNSARNGIKKAYDFTQKIPVIGDLVNTAIDKGIPQIGGQSVRDLAGKASGYLDKANNFGDQLNSITGE